MLGPRVLPRLRSLYRGGGSRGDAGWVPAQVASRHVALLALVKLLPRWLVTVLLRTGLLHRLSPVFRMAATSHSQAVAQLTADRDLRALLSYLFYGQGPPR